MGPRGPILPVEWGREAPHFTLTPVQIAVVAGKRKSAEVAIVRVKYSAVHILLFVPYNKRILRSFSRSDVYTPWHYSATRHKLRNCPICLKIHNFLSITPICTTFFNICLLSMFYTELLRNPKKYDHFMWYSYSPS